MVRFAGRGRLCARGRPLVFLLSLLLQLDRGQGGVFTAAEWHSLDVSPAVPGSLVAGLDEDVARGGGRSRKRESRRAAPEKRSLCDGMVEALPFLSEEVERWQVQGQQACVAPVKEEPSWAPARCEPVRLCLRLHVEHCISRHPFWACSFSNGHCICRWSTACHGVSDALQAADSASLVCRPGGDDQAAKSPKAALLQTAPAPPRSSGRVQVAVRAGGTGVRARAEQISRLEQEALEEEAVAQAGVCQCSGFRACPTEAHGWQCSLARDIPASQSKGLWQANRSNDSTAAAASQNASNASEPTQQGGTATNASQVPVSPVAGVLDLCRCRSSGEPTVLYLSPAERKAIREHPLSEIMSSARTQQKKTGVSGKTIKKQVRQHSTDGKERVVLTISDGKRHKAPKGADGRSAQEDEGDSESAGDGGGSGGKPATHGHQQRGDDGEDGGAEDGDGARPSGSKGGSEEDQRDDELTESCVVTDGRPGFQGRHMLVLGAMLIPLLMVLVVMAQIRWRCVRSPCGGRRRSSGAGPGGPGPGAAPDDAVATPPHAAGQAQQAVEAPAEVERRPPTAVVTLLVLFVVLMRITVTVIVSTSHILVNKSDGRQAHQGQKPGHPFSPGQGESSLGGASSGLLIAAEPVGGVVGMILAQRTRLMWPKETWLASCLIVFIGCVGFIVGIHLQSFWIMLSFRAFSGLGEGACFIGQVFVSRLSSPNVRTEVFSIWELGVAAGLILGPVLTSVSSHVFSNNVTLALEGGVMIAVFMAVCLFIAFWLFCPSSEELCAAAGVSAVERPAWQVDAEMTEEKWAAVLVVCSSTTVRLLSRLVWESSAVLVLTAHFCLGYSNSGYVASFVILFHFCFQAAFVRLASWMSDHNLVRCCELMELFGLVLMFRPPRDLEKTIEDDIMVRESALVGIMIFLFGSGLFYTGNCLTSAPLNSWGTKRGPREVCVLFYQNVSVSMGVAGGAILSRVFAAADPHQNTLVFVLLPAVLAQILLSEMGLGACAPEHESACAAEAAAPRGSARKDSLTPQVGA